MFREDVAHNERHTAHIFEAHSGTGIEIYSQLIGMIEIVCADGMRIQIDASEVDDPEKLCGVADYNLSRSAPGRKSQLHGLDPVGMTVWRALLKKRLALSAVHVTFEHNRPGGDSA